MDLQDIRARIAAGASVAVLSGAGISAASGIPTFRGAQDALWSRYRPEDLATPAAFARDPELVWRWYDWRRGLIAHAAPNAAHRALAALEAHAPVTVVTQNVDGYHRQAGSATVLEYHGSIWTVRCTGCGDEHEDRQVPLAAAPRCAGCGALLRPGVVWFGEMIDPEVMRGAEQAASDCEVFLVVGTAGAVWPAAGLVAVARAGGAVVVEFNLEPSAVSGHTHLFVAGSAADTLGGIVP
ncbi:MAG: NAD-dependent deacylase [Candidatus Krumholzibacteriia bacterium]